MNTCQICNSELTNIKLVFRATMKSAPRNRSRYQAWCPSCSIYLTKTYNEWITSPITSDQLEEEISESDLNTIQDQIIIQDQEDPVFNKLTKWKTFYSMKQTEDKIFKYTRKIESGNITGLVIKRDEFLIGFFVYDF